MTTANSRNFLIIDRVRKELRTSPGRRGGVGRHMDEHADRRREFDARADDEREERAYADQKRLARVAAVVEQLAEYGAEEGRDDADGRKEEESGEDADRGADGARTEPRSGRSSTPAGNSRRR